MTASRRRWLAPLLGTLAVLAVTGLVMSWLFFTQWSDVRDALPPEAARAFAEAIDAAGGPPPYIAIGDDGSIIVRHDLEGASPEDFDTLTMMAWLPAEEKIVRVDYPRWFVRMKTASSLNLGTMIAATRRDWGHLDLSISYDDLRRRGPALLLDHRLENGARIVLWTSRRPVDRTP